MADKKTVVKEEVVVNTTFNVRSAAAFSRKMMEIAKIAEATSDSVKRIGDPTIWKSATDGASRFAAKMASAHKHAMAIVNLAGRMGGAFANAGMGGVGAAGMRGAGRRASGGVADIYYPPGQRLLGPGPMRPAFMLPPARIPTQLPRSSLELKRTQARATSAAYNRVMDSFYATARAQQNRIPYIPNSPMGPVPYPPQRSRYAGGFSAGTIPLAQQPQRQSVFTEALGMARAGLAYQSPALSRAGEWVRGAAGQVGQLASGIPGRVGNWFDIRRDIRMNRRMEAERANAPKLREMYSVYGYNRRGQETSSQIGIPGTARPFLDRAMAGLAGQWKGGKVPILEVEKEAKKIAAAFETGGTKASKRIGESMVTSGKIVGKTLSWAISKIGGGALRSVGLGGLSPSGLMRGLLTMPFNMMKGVHNMLMLPFKAITRIRHMFWNLAFMGGMGATLGYAGVKAMRPAGQREMWQKQFAVIMGEGDTPKQKYASGQQGAKSRIQWLTKAAERLPATIEETVEAGRLMTVFGIFNEKNFETAGDAALAYNKSLEMVAETLGRLKMGAFGLAMRSLRTLGISTDKLKGEGITFKGAAPQQDAGTILKAVMSIWQKEVGGLSRNIGDSFEVVLSNVGDSWRNMLASVTEKLLGGWKAGLESIGRSFGFIGRNVSIPESVGAKIGGLGVGISNMITGVATPQGRKRMRGQLAELAILSRSQRLGLDDVNGGVQVVGGKPVTAAEKDTFMGSAWASSMEILKNTLNNAFVTGTALLGAEFAKLPAYLTVAWDGLVGVLGKTGVWLSDLFHQTFLSLENGMRNVAIETLEDAPIPGARGAARQMRAGQIARFMNEKGRTAEEESKRSDLLGNFGTAMITGDASAAVRYDQATGKYYRRGKPPLTSGENARKRAGAFLLGHTTPGMIARGFGFDFNKAAAEDLEEIPRHVAQKEYINYMLANNPAQIQQAIPLHISQGRRSSSSWVPFPALVGGRGTPGSAYENRLGAARELLSAGNAQSRGILGAAGKGFEWLGEAGRMTGVPMASKFLAGEKASREAALLAARTEANAMMLGESFYKSDRNYNRARQIGELPALKEVQREHVRKRMEAFDKESAFTGFVAMSTPETFAEEVGRRGDIYGRKDAAHKVGLTAQQEAMRKWDASRKKMYLAGMKEAGPVQDEGFWDIKMLSPAEKRERQKIGEAAYYEARAKAASDPKLRVDPAQRQKYIDEMNRRAAEVRTKIEKDKEDRAEVVKIAENKQLDMIAVNTKENSDKTEVLLTKTDSLIAGIGELTAALVGAERELA